MAKSKGEPNKEKQSARFVEKARELGADETAANFETIIKKIVLPKHPHKTSRDDTEK